MRRPPDLPASEARATGSHGGLDERRPETAVGLGVRQTMHHLASMQVGERHARGQHLVLEQLHPHVELLGAGSLLERVDEFHLEGGDLAGARLGEGVAAQHALDRLGRGRQLVRRVSRSQG